MADQIEYAYCGDITKAERDESGNLMVFGKATGSDMDLDEQYADPEWLKEAMPDWAKWGNLREMHQPIVAGIGRETTSDDSGNWFLKSEVVDEGTARKIEAGALKGYSIGIKNAKVVKDAKAPGGRIVGGTIVEVSYVDRPCNPTSTIGIAKMVGAELAPVESETPGTSWLAKQGGRAKQPVTAQPAKGEKPAPDKYPDDKHACPLCAGTGTFKKKVKKAAEPDLLARIENLEKHAGKGFGAGGNGKDSSGRDISNVSSKDFAGPNGTFPIVDRDDVSNAASLAHHAANPAAVRAKIRRIAKRKFQMQDEEMPKSLRGAKASKKAKASNKSVKAMVTKAVAASTADLTARAEAAEAELAKISKTVVPGGPRPMGYPESPTEEARAVMSARLMKYKRLADSVTDGEVRKGYQELAKKLEGELGKLA